MAGVHFENWFSRMYSAWQILLGSYFHIHADLRGLSKLESVLTRIATLLISRRALLALTCNFCIQYQRSTFANYLLCCLFLLATFRLFPALLELRSLEKLE